MTQKHTNSRMQKKLNDFRLKYGNQKKHNEKAEWINNITKELEGLEEGPKAEIYIDLLKMSQKKYLTGKRQAMMEYMVSGSRNSPPFTSSRNEQMPAYVPEWMTTGKTTLIQKDSSKGTAPNNYRPITEKSSYGQDWPQKGIWYGPARLDNKLPQNVQNITWSHKLYRENHENLESGIDSRRKKLRWSKDPKGYISRRCSITVNIHDCHDTT